MSLSIYFDQKTGKEHVDIITFYNEIFIPAVKPLLVELGPGGTTTRTNRVPEVNNNNEGICLFTGVYWCLHNMLSLLVFSLIRTKLSCI